MARILIVDDHALSRLLLSSILQSHGHETVEAADGAAALELAQCEPPDLIISDALMPRMDGFSLCRAWMADTRLAHIPFLFYSASYPSESDQRFGLGLGASAYLKKPMPSAQLVEAVESQLTGPPADPVRSEMDAHTFDTTHHQLVMRKLETKITELNTLNDAYKTQGQEYARLFTANPQPMWIYELETLRVLAANDAAVASYGYSRDEWLGMTLKDLRPPEDISRLLADIERHRDTPFSDADVWTHLKKDGTRIQVEISAHSLDFEGRRARVVTALDVTERVRGQQREQAHLRRLEEAMRGTVLVVTRMVELRDPYTAGHERRTAALCTAIATELGLDTDRIEGLSMAALIHDIGKISIPSDILTKPGMLSPIERAYIEQHAQAGYELLRDLNFPWPLAEMVGQHHERMDGSGYPKGLKGEEILLEARIIAVADTIEAMASHRPYRPAFSLDQALGEVESHAGQLYDSEVVAACIRLFRERDYVIPGSQARHQATTGLP